MSFEAQNHLERSLMRATSDPAHRPQFIRDFAGSDILVIEHGRENVPSGRRMLEAGTTLKVVNIDWNGRPVIPVFSSLARLQEAIRSEVSFVSLNALEFMKITRGADWVLNPGAEYGKEFPAAELASILDGSIWQPTCQHVFEQETRVLLGQPSVYPAELTEALARYFRRTKGVKRAFLAHFFNPERDEKPHTLIGVEATGGWDEVMAGVEMVVGGVHVPDPPVDFIRIGGEKGGVEDYFVRECKPFYERKLFGFL